MVLGAPQEACLATLVPHRDPVTTSIGIAVFPDHASDPATLVRHADRALYVAKRGGRNRVERFADSPAPAAS